MIKRNIPNAITCANLLCGCLAVVKIFEGDLVWGAYLIGIAALLDFFDGMAARLLKVSSLIGKDLDSLADMVSFGLVPGLMMFRMIDIFSHEHAAGANRLEVEPLTYVAFILPVFSAIRLARFNNDTRQAESFIGLPTPANAIFICSLPLILYMAGDYSVRPEMWLMERMNEGEVAPARSNAITELLKSRELLAGICIVNASLLLTPLPLFALKFKHFKWKGNEIRFIFLLWSVLLLAFLQFAGVPLVIISYVLFSIVNNLTKKTST